MSSIAGIPVQQLRGVGPKLAATLAEYGVHRVEDLLFHLPLRYQDRTRITPIGAAPEGADVVVEGEIRVADVVFGRRRSLVARIQDGSGTLTLRFFYFTAAQEAQMERGVKLRCFGETRRGPMGLEIVHPEYKRADAADAQKVVDVLTPVYPSTEGLQQGEQT